MNNVLLIKLRHKKEACKIWKQGQAIQEEYKETIQHTRWGKESQNPPGRILYGTWKATRQASAST